MIQASSPRIRSSAAITATVAVMTVLTVAGASASSRAIPGPEIDSVLGMLAWLAATIEDLVMILQDTVEGWTWA